MGNDTVVAVATVNAKGVVFGTAAKARQMILRPLTIRM